MKKALPVLLLSFYAFSLQSQATFIPDTLLLQTFTVDPSDTMLIFPSGNDTHWVNWDADNLESLCGDNGEVIPSNWFWESDFGDLNNPPINSAFTSCSYFGDSIKVPVENWLITSPVYIPDSATVLQWRSLSVQVPLFMDGYKVLVSRGSNEPFTNAFTDTLFVAAEMIQAPNPPTFNPNDYVFSPGYVHADGVTNAAYYFLIKPDAGTYTGRLEPHEASLADYAGDTIYIAFLHDSTDDLMLQIDDIAVIHGPTISADGPGAANYYLRVLPNPATTSTTISWKFPTRQEGLLVVRDLLGRTVLEQPVDDLSTGRFFLNTQALPQGSYACSLQTAQGQQTILLVKR